MTTATHNLHRALEDKSARIGVMGLGYVGLPLLCTLSEKGFPVLGFDTDQEKIRQLRDRKSYLKVVSDERITQFENNETLLTADAGELGKADVLMVCVPTPLNRNREPDMRFVVASTESIAKVLRPGQLIILESTTYPGTTREVMLPILQKTGLTCGEDFFLGYSPEREDPGNPNYSTSTIPKVMAGYSENCLKLVNLVYSNTVSRTVQVSTLETAEATKLFENIFRSVNIALVNEMKLVLDKMGIDVWEVIEAAATKPFGFMPFYPGPGLGGHCIPIDPFYLTWRAREFECPTKFIELAGEINTHMPEFVLTKVAEGLNEHAKPLRNSKILLIGMAYKPGVDDTRESPSLRLIELLKRSGAVVSYHDPLVPTLKPTRRYQYDMTSLSLAIDTLSDMDAVLIATAQSDVDYDLIAKHASLIIDTRGVMRSRQTNGTLILA